REEELHSLAGVKIVANLLKGFKTKSLLNSTAKTHRLMLDLKNALEELNKTEERHVEDPNLRREIYGHIKFLKERTFDLVNIEKQRKRLFPLSIFASFEKKKLEKTYQEVMTLVDNYYEEWNFTDDEIEQFQSLTLEAHHPKREHL